MGMPPLEWGGVRAFGLDMSFGWLHGSWGILVVYSCIMLYNNTLITFDYMKGSIFIRVQTGGGCSLAHKYHQGYSTLCWNTSRRIFCSNCKHLWIFVDSSHHGSRHALMLPGAA